MILSFDYRMNLKFGGAGEKARDHAFSLRCLPQESAAQHVLRRNLDVSPKPDSPLVYAADGFGNRFCYGSISEPHREFQVHLTGETETGESADFFPGQQEAVSTCGGISCGYESARAVMQMPYRQQTPLTSAGARLREAHRQLGTFAPGREWERAEQICLLIHDQMRYIRGSTGMKTCAETAWEARQGVCQDYAQIMLTLLRMDRIACRYTAGLLIGEGETHAWVEAAIRGKWIPFDPTNPDMGPGSRVIFSHGRDALDCEISRGVFLGGGTQSQNVEARVHTVPIAEMSGNQPRFGFAPRSDAL